MPCLLILLALLLPRLVMFLIWLTTNWFGVVYQSSILPLLGFLFLPYTTLAYLGAILTAGAVTPGWLAILIVAVVVDAGHWGGGYRYRGGHRRSHA